MALLAPRNQAGQRPFMGGPLINQGPSYNAANAGGGFDPGWYPTEEPSYVGQGQTTEEEDPPQGGPQGPQPPTMDEWNYRQRFGGGGNRGGFSPGSLNYDDYEATTREVQDEELASWQLNQMLESDSPYMDQARRAGERSAAKRGALSSSIFAGASQASAIQAAAPIAQSDATAFRQAAGQNQQAQNQMSLAKLQSETGVLQSSIAASASVASASIAANANKEISSMRIHSERDMAEFSSAHDSFMETLRQEGRIELFDLDANLREHLMEKGFGHDINMAELGHEQQLDLQDALHRYSLDQIGYQGSVNSYLQNQQIQGGFLGQLSNGVFQSVNTISQLGLDDQGFQEAMNNIWGTTGSMMQMFNYWVNEGQFPEIEIGGG